MFQGIAKPISRVYFGVRSRIHLRHFRGRSIHSPFMYGMVRHVFMRNRIDSDDQRLYECLRAEGVKSSTAIMLQNLQTYCTLRQFILTTPQGSEKRQFPDNTLPSERKLRVILPGVQPRTLIDTAREAALEHDVLVILAPHLTRRGREAAQSIRHRYPCVSVDRGNLMIFIFDPKLQPQHYHI